VGEKRYRLFQTKKIPDKNNGGKPWREQNKTKGLLHRIYISLGKDGRNKKKAKKRDYAEFKLLIVNVSI
jgi:hypothetical protein